MSGWDTDDIPERNTAWKIACTMLVLAGLLVIGVYVVASAQPIVRSVGDGCHTFVMTNGRDTNYAEVTHWGHATCVVPETDGATYAGLYRVVPCGAGLCLVRADTGNGRVVRATSPSK